MASALPVHRDDFPSHSNKTLPFKRLYYASFVNVSSNSCDKLVMGQGLICLIQKFAKGASNI